MKCSLSNCLEMRKSSLVPVFACVFELRKPLRRLPVILNLSKFQVFHTVVSYVTVPSAAASHLEVKFYWGTEEARLC